MKTLDILAETAAGSSFFRKAIWADVGLHLFTWCTFFYHMHNKLGVQIAVPNSGQDMLQLQMKQNVHSRLQVTRMPSTVFFQWPVAEILKVKGQRLWKEGKFSSAHDRRGQRETPTKKTASRVSALGIHALFTVFLAWSHGIASKKWSREGLKELPAMLRLL